MARHTINTVPIGPENFDNGDPFVIIDGLTSTIARNTMRRVRDAMRAKFTANAVLNDSTGYTVSDIFINTKAAVTGIGFFVRDNANGCEWIILTGETTNTNPIDIDDWLGSSGVILRQHVVLVGSAFNNLGTTSPSNGLVVIYNDNVAGSAASSIGFNDLTALTFTGGDFSASGLDIDSSAGLTALRNGSVYGFDFSTIGVNYIPYSFTFEDDATRPSLSVLAGESRDALYYGINGRIVTPALGGDTNQQALMQGFVSNNEPSGSRGAFAFASPSGTLQAYQLEYPAIGEEDTYINDAGTFKYNFRFVNLINGTAGAGTKGSIKREIALITGPTTTYQSITRNVGFLSNGQPMFKFVNDLAFMHEDGVIPFPFIEDLGVQYTP